MTCKQILDLEDDELAEMMTDDEFKRMRKLGMQYVWELLDFMQDGVRASNMEEDEEYTTISDYLAYMEESESNKEEELRELNEWHDYLEEMESYNEI